jgi:hypothetical protein
LLCLVESPIPSRAESPSRIAAEAAVHALSEKRLSGLAEEQLPRTHLSHALNAVADSLRSGLYRSATAPADLRVIVSGTATPDSYNTQMDGKRLPTMSVSSGNRAGDFGRAEQMDEEQQRSNRRLLRRLNNVRMLELPDEKRQLSTISMYERCLLLI